MRSNEKINNQSTKKNNSLRLLIVAEKNNIYDEAADTFTRNHFTVQQTFRYSDAFSIAISQKPDVMILDSAENELSALEFCNAIKSMNDMNHCIVIMVSARKDELMEIASFNSGADDFVSAPFKLKALVERVKVRMKSPGKTITIVHDYQDAAPLKIDRDSYSVSLGNQFIQLSRKEFELLYLMASHPEKLFKREEIFRIIWNKETLGKNRTIDVHISRLRQKLGNRFISSQKGMGYRFKAS